MAELEFASGTQSHTIFTEPHCLSVVRIKMGEFSFCLACRMALAIKKFIKTTYIFYLELEKVPTREPEIIFTDENIQLCLGNEANTVNQQQHALSETSQHIAHGEERCYVLKRKIRCTVVQQKILAGELEPEPVITMEEADVITLQQEEEKENISAEGEIAKIHLSFNTDVSPQQQEKVQTFTIYYANYGFFPSHAPALSLYAPGHHLACLIPHTQGILLVCSWSTFSVHLSLYTARSTLRTHFPACSSPYLHTSIPADFWPSSAC